MSKIEDKKRLESIIEKIYNIEYSNFSKSDREIINYLREHNKSEKKID